MTIEGLQVFSEATFLCETADAVVATDDERIAECCRGFGAAVVLTSEKCDNGISLLPIIVEI